MRTLTARIRQFFASFRRAQPAGCCGCGAKTVRYVYAGPWRGRMVPDDARCTVCGPIPGHPVTVDYGADVEVTVGEMDDAVTAATTDHAVARLATTAGLTVGQLRHLIHHLPANTPVRVEDPSRPGPVPGSTAEHVITGAATGMPLHAGGDGVLLLIDPTD